MISKWSRWFCVCVVHIAVLLYGCESTPPELRIKFASVQEGERTLLANDLFLAGIQNSDIAQRLCHDTMPTMQSYLNTLRGCVQEWTEDEKANLQRLFDSIELSDPALTKLLANQEIVLIKTSGAESANAFYTRFSAIVLPVTSFAWVDQIQVLRHELFHILSRNNASIRRKLYALLKYEILDQPFQLSDSVRQHLIHNPDSPVLDYVRRRSDSTGKEVLTSVVLVQYGECLFDSVETKEITLDRVNGTLQVHSVRKAPEIYDVPEEELAYAFERVSEFANLRAAVDSVLTIEARIP